MTENERNILLKKFIKLFLKFVLRELRLTFYWSINIEKKRMKTLKSSFCSVENF